MIRVVRFTASWCAPCKGLAMQLANVETDVPIEVVDIDEQMDRAAAASVRSVPTMVMYDGFVNKRSKESPGEGFYHGTSKRN